MSDLKFKENCEQISVCDDFFYYLSRGGWIKPEDYLEDEDAKKLAEAILLIEKFEEQGTELGYFEEC